ncbi:MAG: DUF3859 domain-containing protein [Phycisphaerae bacterium]|nr:DUF3859 domain-containing protein [Phycisphaerae bacterium]
MSKKLKHTIKSFGIYESFDKDSKDLPRFLERTKKIPAVENIEFGYVLHITGGKGKKLTFKIDHPPFADDEGNIRPPFSGEIYVSSNDYKFYLGDRVWLPLNDKLGPWRLRTFCEGITIADKTLTIIPA